MADHLNILHEISCAKIDAAADVLNAISRDIWEHPELKFEEKYCHNALCDFLEKYDFDVERHYVLNTAFKATFGEIMASTLIISQYNSVTLYYK